MRVKSKTLARRHSLPIIPAIVLAGGGLGPAHALELGEIKVQSHLGQPLRASIAYALAADEAIADYCVSLAPASSVNGMPALNDARISVANGVISLTGSTPLREPLVAARLSVQCPYTPNIARDYMLFVDPAPVAVDRPAVVNQPAAQATTAAPVATRRPAPQAAPAQTAPTSAKSPAKPSIVTGSRYRVQPGDSLSDIASRLEGRQVGLWQAVNAIFAANPQAFIDNDPNRLKAGSLLTIPLGTALGDVGTQFADEPTGPSVSTAGSDDTAYLEPAGSSAQPAANSTAVDESLNAENPFAGNTVDTVIDPSVVAAETSGNAESAAVATPITPITQAPAPAPAAETIERSTPVRAGDALSARTEAPASDTGIVWWTLGGALALITGLFFFRRRRQPVDPAPIADRPAPHPRDRYAEEDSIEVEVISAPGSEYGESIDFDLSDDSPTEENPALDADLVAGNGLSGEATTGADGLDFDFDAQATLLDGGDTSETDILPPPQRTASILESEVLPEEDDEYDMSVIVDATKMPRPEDATQRDFHAVVVDEDESAEDEESYTLNQEIDYQILEQDYEDELTATQALNMEIERAARELEHSMHDDEAADAAETVESKTLANDKTQNNETLANDETTALPLASVTELDLTANMPAGNDDDSELAAEATGLTEELTAQLPLEDATQELPAQDDTVEVTAKLRVEGGKRGG